MTVINVVTDNNLVVSVSILRFFVSVMLIKNGVIKDIIFNVSLYTLSLIFFRLLSVLMVEASRRIFKE